MSVLQEKDCSVGAMRYKVGENIMKHWCDCEWKKNVSYLKELCGLFKELQIKRANNSLRNCV